MQCKFIVGQKVVCILKRKWRRFIDGRDAIGPGDGEVCKIMEIIVLAPQFDYIGLRVEGYAGVYNHIRFKPLDDRKTDISTFTKLLTPTKVLEPV